MKLPPGTAVSAALAFEGPASATPAARLAMSDGLAQLEWSPEVVERRLNVSALLYPPEPGLQPARSRDFHGLHGFLTDSLPDGWGYLIMRKRLAKLGVDIRGLTPLERLALVGDRGRGALTYVPATAPADEVEGIDLDSLAQASTALLTGEEGRLGDTLALLAGGSGGARPKVHVGFDGKGGFSAGEAEMAPGHTAWLVKFRAPEDPHDIGPIEEAYAAMAEAAGLTISPHRLIPAKHGPGYFAARRFDRPEGGGRLHMISLAGAIEAPSDRPAVGYDMFLRATHAITRRSGDVAEAFRRMIFNVLASNRDDHTRQHAYLMTPDGDWRLAPAFDLTYSPGPGGEHYLDIAGEGRNPTRGHVEKVGAKHGFDARRTAAVIDEVKNAVDRWSDFAQSAGVSPASMREIADAHAQVWATFIR